MSSENNMKKTRQEAGITRTQLARVSEISDKTIRGIENRRISGKVETKASIVNGLNLITGNNYEYKDIFPHG